MASSELSSSEINQGQGLYHDGKNEVPGVPALPEPLTPAEVIIEAEEGMWKKFSSNYEFPLALLIALSIHVIAVLFVVAFMTINIYWGAPKLPVTGVVDLEPPRIHQDGQNDKERQGGGPGGGDPSNETFEPILLSKPDSIKFDDPDPKQPLPLTLEPKGLNRNGKPGTGIGPGSGPGAGPGNGVGVPMGRNRRWQFDFSYQEPELFLSQLSNLQVTVATRLNNGRFLVFKNLGATTSFKYEEMVDSTFADFVNGAKKLWFINNDRVTCENFAYAVNLSERPMMLVMVIPQVMENAVLAAELKHHKMTEDEVRAKRLVTSFTVVRDSTGWKVNVTKSRVLK